MEITQEMILEYLKNALEDAELVELWNIYCDNDYIFPFDDPESFFNETFGTAYDACRALQFGEVSWNDCYITFDGYGNLKSSNYFDDLGNYEDLAEEVFPHWQVHFTEEEILEYNS